MRRIRKAASIAAAALAAAGAAVALPVGFAHHASAAATCEGIQWEAGDVYVGDDLVSHQDREYRAKWWTTGETPGTTGQWGVWEDLGACDGAGPTTPPTEEPTGEPTEAPTGGPNQGNARLTGYWHNFDNGSGVMELSAIPAEYDIIAIAFAEATATAGQVDFALDASLTAAGYTEDEFKSDVAALKAQGRQSSSRSAARRATSPSTTAPPPPPSPSSVLCLMAEYGFDGVDIDLEHGINAGALETALRAITPKPRASPTRWPRRPSTSSPLRAGTTSSR